MSMRMLKERNYQGKLMRAGDIFEPSNDAHRRQFLAIKHAEDVEDEPKKKRGRPAKQEVQESAQESDGESVAEDVTEEVSEDG